MLLSWEPVLCAVDEADSALQLHKWETEAWEMGQPAGWRRERSPLWFMPLLTLCTGLPFLSWLRMWRERCCLVIRTWDKKRWRRVWSSAVWSLGAFEGCCRLGQASTCL